MTSTLVFLPRPETQSRSDDPGDVFRQVSVSADGVGRLAGKLYLSFSDTDLLGWCCDQVAVWAVLFRSEFRETFLVDTDAAWW